MSAVVNHHIPVWVTCVVVVIGTVAGFISTDNNNDRVIQEQFSTISTQLELNAALVRNVSTVQVKDALETRELLGSLNEKVHDHETRITVLEVKTDAVGTHNDIN